MQLVRSRRCQQRHKWGIPVGQRAQTPSDVTEVVACTCDCCSLKIFQELFCHFSSPEMGKKTKHRDREREEGDEDPPPSAKKTKGEPATVEDAAGGTAGPDELALFQDEPNDNIASQQDHEELERMRVMVEAFSDHHQDRYEQYRRSSLPRSQVKRLMQAVVGSGVAIQPNAVIAMNGVTKVFVGEIVEEALDYRDSLNETGPLKPNHIREAVRRLRNRGHSTFQLASLAKGPRL